MSTAFATLQASLLAAIVATPSLAGGRVSVNRMRPIPAGQDTAIVLRLEAAEGHEFVIGSIDWNSTYVVECYARGSAGADPESAVDTLLLDTWARLAALDFSQIGAAVTVDPKIQWQYDETDTPIVCAVIHLSAQHTTTSASLAPRS